MMRLFINDDESPRVWYFLLPVTCLLLLLVVGGNQEWLENRILAGVMLVVSPLSLVILGMVLKVLAGVYPSVLYVIFRASLIIAFWLWGAVTCFNRSLETLI